MQASNAPRNRARANTPSHHAKPASRAPVYAIVRQQFLACSQFLAALFAASTLDKHSRAIAASGSFCCLDIRRRFDRTPRNISFGIPDPSIAPAEKDNSSCCLRGRDTIALRNNRGFFQSTSSPKKLPINSAKSPSLLSPRSSNDARICLSPRWNKSIACSAATSQSEVLAFVEHLCNAAIIFLRSVLALST